MQLPAVREAIGAHPTSLETAAVQAGQQQRHAQLKMAVMEQLHTKTMAGMRVRRSVSWRAPGMPDASLSTGSPNQGDKPRSPRLLGSTKGQQDCCGRCRASCFPPTPGDKAWNSDWPAVTQ